MHPKNACARRCTRYGLVDLNEILDIFKDKNLQIQL